MKRRLGRLGGFTLVELLVVIAIVVVLAAVGVSSFRRVQDRAYQARCLGNMRSLVAGALTFAADRNGWLWSRAEVGYSKYRMIDDPLGLPKLLEEYVNSPKTWMCPGGRKSLAKFGNNYTWNAPATYEQNTIYTFKEANTAVMIWDTYQYSLPSMYGASDDFKGDGTSSAGPQALNNKFFTRPHREMTSVTWGCVDGHVVCGPKVQ